MDYIPPTIEIQQQSSVAPSGVAETVAEDALSFLRKRNPGTTYLNAWPSDIPGMIAVQLSDNSIGYTDLTGRFLILGIAFDFDTGRILNFKDGVPSVQGTSNFSGAMNE